MVSCTKTTAGSSSTSSSTASGGLLIDPAVVLPVARHQSAACVAMWHNGHSLHWRNRSSEPALLARQQNAPQRVDGSSEVPERAPSVVGHEAVGVAAAMSDPDAAAYETP